MPAKKMPNTQTIIGASKVRPLIPGIKVTDTGWVLASAKIITSRNKATRKTNLSSRIPLELMLTVLEGLRARADPYPA